MSAAPARAQDMRVDRLEIVESGFFDSADVKVTGAKPAAGVVTGTVQQLGALKLLPEPPAKSARLGIGFGVRSRASDSCRSRWENRRPIRGRWSDSSD